jgi:hypothetical protein
MSAALADDIMKYTYVGKKRNYNPQGVVPKTKMPVTVVTVTKE